MTKIEICVPEGMAASRADKALAKLLPDVPGHAIRAAFQKRDVKRNGVRIGQDEQVFPGDTLTLYVNAPSVSPLEIVFEDHEYIVINKRQGVSTQGEGSAEALCAGHTGAPVFACHRLDVQTGGLLLLAKTQAALLVAEQAFAAHKLQKTYRALVRGCPAEREATLRAYLQKDARAAKVRVTDTPAPGSRRIETRYRVLEPGRDVSRLEIDLITGRTHQIRAHLANIGHPVLGDDKYGDHAFNRAHGVRKQKLWAVKLTLWDGRTFQVQEDF